MKVLLTGTTGYISGRIEQWLSIANENYELEKISVRNITNDFRLPKNIEVIIHTAALVHKKESNYTEQDYFDVNYSLTIKLAKLAKEASVKHFIFFSTMAVFSDVGRSGEITSHTPLAPVTMYGKSKLAAESELMELSNEQFVVSIVRPPMVYGPNCPGNYALLSKVAKKLSIFPSIKNNRSMVFIDNLSEFTRQLILNRDEGVFHPQDQTYICTSEMVKEIADTHQRKIRICKLAGFVLKTVFSRLNLVSKVFGNLTYSKEMSVYRDNSYQLFGFKEAVRKSELEN